MKTSIHKYTCEERVYVIGAFWGKSPQWRKLSLYKCICVPMSSFLWSSTLRTEHPNPFFRCLKTIDYTNTALMLFSTRLTKSWKFVCKTTINLWRALTHLESRKSLTWFKSRRYFCKQTGGTSSRWILWELWKLCQKFHRLIIRLVVFFQKGKIRTFLKAGCGYYYDIGVIIFF